MLNRTVVIQPYKLFSFACPQEVAPITWTTNQES